MKNKQTLSYHQQAVVVEIFHLREGVGEENLKWMIPTSAYVRERFYEPENVVRKKIDEDFFISFEVCLYLCFSQASIRHNFYIQLEIKQLILELMLNYDRVSDDKASNYCGH